MAVGGLAQKLRKHCKACGLRCKAAGQRRLVQYYLGLDEASRAERLKDTRRTGTFATAAPFVRIKTALESASAATRLLDCGTSRAGSNRPAEEGESVGRGPEAEKQISCKRCACKNAMLCLQIQKPSAQACCALGRMAYEDLFSRHRNPTIRLVTPVLNKRCSRRSRSSTQFSRSCRQQARRPRRDRRRLTVSEGWTKGAAKPERYWLIPAQNRHRPTAAVQ